MIGIIHKVLADVLRELGGQSLVDTVATRSGADLDTIRIVDARSDDEFSKLLAVVLDETGIPRPQLIQRYSAAFLDYAERLFPRFFEISDSTRTFLLKQPKIHASIGAGLTTLSEKEAVYRKFEVEDCSDGSLRVIYQSKVGLCDLYQTLAYQLAERYDDQLTVMCEHCGRGAGCTMRLYFGGSKPEQGVKQCLWTKAA